MLTIPVPFLLMTFSVVRDQQHRFITETSKQVFNFLPERIQAILSVELSRLLPQPFFSSYFSTPSYT